MRRWLQSVGQKMQVWMYGRNGYDELSKFLSIVAIVCVILSIFVPILSPIGLVLIVWSTFRTYSRNTTKRQRERAFYLKRLRRFP